MKEPEFEELNDEENKLALLLYEKRPLNLNSTTRIPSKIVF